MLRATPLKTTSLAAAVLAAGLHVPRTVASQDESGRLRITASMSSARAAHTATLLESGDVLVVGGFGDQGLAGAEIFAPDAGRFTAAGAPTLLRQSHSATRLRDGRVLIAGGLVGDGHYTNTVDLYDPETRAFRATSPMTVARAGHEAVVLSDGRVLMIGGVGTGWTFLDSAEIYDPATGRFVATGAMSEARESHTAVRLTDGRVLVAGGHRGRGADVVISSTAEIFDPTTGRFTPTSPMAMRRHKHDSIAMADGRVAILGGADERDSGGVYSNVEMFDAVTARFSLGSPLRAGRYKHRGTTVRLSNGHLLLAGGASQIEEYDPASGAGQSVQGDIRLAGQFSTATALLDGRVLIAGGYGGGSPHARATAWIYEPIGWTRR